MNIIAFAPKVGTAKKKYDYRSFQGWARKFLKYHDQPSENLVIIDNTKRPRAMRAQVIRALKAAGEPDVVALFCHGTPRKIQLGFNRYTLKSLAEVLAWRCDVRVVLYACLAGKGPGPGGDRGFADELRDAICKAGGRYCRVVAHTTAGRADKNPFVRSFDGDGSSTGGAGGYYLVNRTLLDERGRKILNPLWPPWVKALAKDMRWELPCLSREEIHAVLIEEP